MRSGEGEGEGKEEEEEGEFGWMNGGGGQISEGEQG